ncbi:MAG: hypothetical protein Q7S78_01190 [Candidatus Azambacteria bacterium]|nr:hypothetical protein [Candidatus Azambacteria bacterium]
MEEPTPKQTEDIIIRTMKGDLGVPVPNVPAPKLPPVETKLPAPVTPVILPPPPPPMPKMEKRDETQRNATPALERPPVLIVPPKIIPPKEIPIIPVKPLYKATPAWLKLGGIGLIIIGIALSGLYGYWKIFIQSKSATSANPPASTSTIPTLPFTPSATSTIPSTTPDAVSAGFFNKLPNKEITIDLPAKTPIALAQALKSEAKIVETRASVKQIKITYKGIPLAIEEFLNLFSIFIPKDFLSNYENEFAFAFFAQKEGARPILILKTKNKELANTQMTEWEKTTLANDVLPLFLNNVKLPQYLPSFRTYLFVNQPVRFLNISASFASLNYAVYNNYLVFTTSSAGMFVVLQDLTGQAISQSYLENLNASINEFIK